MSGPCSIEQIRSLVRMDEQTGELHWLPRAAGLFPDVRSHMAWNSRHAGRRAFCTQSGNGYLHGSLFGVKLCAHRIVFALANGRWPAHTVDHINGDRLDNRPANLRDVPHLQNMRNQPLSKASTTGVTGVSFDSARGKYAAHITVAGRAVHLGRFATLDEAAAARTAANARHAFHPNHGRIA